MRTAFVSLIMATLAASFAAHADSNVTAFPLSDEACVAVGEVTLGANGRWAHCQVTRNGWFATIDNLDLYQTQYCLGSKAGKCEQKALTLFSNIAYTPKAKLLLQRVDSGATAYDDPMTVNTENGVIMTLAKRIGSVSSSTYYYWQANQWLPIEAQLWQRQVKRYFPKNVVLRAKPSLDIGSMRADAKLYRAGDADCCPSGGVAEIDLILSKGRFSVKNVEILPNAK
jgi:hypothetical protein